MKSVYNHLKGPVNHYLKKDIFKGEAESLSMLTKQVKARELEIVDKVNISSKQVCAQKIFYEPSFVPQKIYDGISCTNTSSNSEGSTKNYSKACLVLAGIMGYLVYDKLNNNVNAKERASIADDTNSYQKLLSLIENKEAIKLVKEIKEQDIIIFLGKTRSGKGTIINQLIGNKVEAFEDPKTYKISVRKSDISEKGPGIADKAVSDTAVPTGWKMKAGYIMGPDLNEMLIDVPGFDDNRGSLQDIANSFYIREILQSAKSVKIVLVADVNHIFDTNIEPFINLIKKIHTIIPNISDYKDSLSIVFSKVNPDRLDANKIRNLLNNKILSEPELEVPRTLIEHFVKNENSVCIAEQPSRQGAIKRDVSSIINSIKTLSKIDRGNLKNVHFGISGESKTELSKLPKKLISNEYLERIVPAITIFYDQKLLKITKSATTESEIKKAQQELAQVKKEIPTGAKILDVLNGFCRLDPTIDNMIKSLNIIPQANFIEYIDSILDEQLSDRVLDRLGGITDCIKYKIEFEETNLRNDLTTKEKENINKKREKDLLIELSNRQNRIKDKEKGYFERVLAPLGEFIDEALLNTPSWLVNSMLTWATGVPTPSK